MSFKQKTVKASFGWLRFEIIGGLINSVFLLSTCFNIVLECVHRFREVEATSSTLEKEINLILIVGSIGLIINLFGLCIFSGEHAGHGHSHGGHSHGSHEQKEHKEKHKKLEHSHSHESHKHGHSYDKCSHKNKITTDEKIN